MLNTNLLEAHRTAFFSAASQKPPALSLDPLSRHHSVLRNSGSEEAGQHLHGKGRD